MKQIKEALAKGNLSKKEILKMEKRQQKLQQQEALREYREQQQKQRAEVEARLEAKELERQRLEEAE